MIDLDYNAINETYSADPMVISDSHGTSCAGIIAMEKGNEHCGVGVAYNSNITGIYTEKIHSRGLGKAHCPLGF